MTEKTALPTPTDVDDAEWATELIRFWVADGVDCVSLRLDGVGSSEGEVPPARIWGAILADLARHILHGQNQVGFSQQDQQAFFAELERGYVERLKQEVGVTGRVLGDANVH